MALPPAITDTNLLLQISAAIARGDQHGTFNAIRSRTFITRSVDEETSERSRSRARSRFKVDPDAMHAAWMNDVRPHLRVVDIKADELEHDAIDQVRMRNADQADIDTAALAVLLSPCMVITGDDDLRAVARPHLTPDVLREIRHAEPSHHAVARRRVPLVAQHTFTQGGTVGGLIAFDMARDVTRRLSRTTVGQITLLVAGGAAVVAMSHPKVRARAASVAKTISDAAGNGVLAVIAAERDCAMRMFPKAEPQNLAHRIAQEITHYPLWLAPSGITSMIDEDPNLVARTCQHKWFSPGVFGSVKVGVKHDALEIIEGNVAPTPAPDA